MLRNVLGLSLDQILRWILPGNSAIGRRTIIVGKIGLNLTVGWEKALALSLYSVPNRLFEFGRSIPHL